MTTKRKQIWSVPSNNKVRLATRVHLKQLEMHVMAVQQSMITARWKQMIYMIKWKLDQAKNKKEENLHKVLLAKKKHF